MYIFSNQYNTKIDDRIHLKTFLNEEGETEVYPLNSFPFEIMMTWENTATTLITSRTLTSNSTFMYAHSKDLKKFVDMLAMSKCGISSGFYFYEQTVLIKEKYVYLYLGLNSINNTRCALISNIDTNRVDSIGNNQPASKWSEREIQDMFNIKITRIADSRRLLLDYKTPKGVMASKSRNYVQPMYSTFYDLYYV